ncbi:MAG: hypothetical protein JXR03_04705 [Cyclobacteriaceae bacterium]
MKNIIIKTTVFSTLFLLATLPLLAQAGPGAPPATPIDGGLSLLLTAGGIYGFKKLRDSRR